MSQDDAPKTDIITTQTPPHTIGGILLRLGPGLIVAGSIVGSGELIATTKSGAEAGFWLLWLIIIGCVIKVFAQVEMGRYTIATGNTTIAGMNEVPGPRFGRWGNWLVWYWFLMFLASLAQLGGIVGGVGQALTICAPITDEGAWYNDFVEARIERTVARARMGMAAETQAEAAEVEKLREAMEGWRSEVLRFDREMLERLNRGAGAAANLTADRFQPLDGEMLYLLEDVGALHQEDAFVRTVKDGRVMPLSEPGAALLRESGLLAGAGDDAVLVPAAADELTKDFKKQLAEAGVVIFNRKPTPPLDDKLWATLIAVVTAVLLVVGRYRLIETFSTAMVAMFTLITIVNLFMLQSTAFWQVNLSDIINGLSFRLPPAAGDATPVSTALKTFGIIGVGASELVTYPYWCLEKGYARFTGPRDKTEDWAERARGWLRVMRWDAWCSMAVYTFATIAFYLLGASILGRAGLNPGGSEMIATLSVMYRPAFGVLTQYLFLFGSFAVLYSTFFVANASHARVFGDALRVLGFTGDDDKTVRIRTRILGGLFPLLCVAVFWFISSPAELVLFSGLMQALMLPMLAGAALYFRYYRVDERICPGRVWDVFLWVSAIGMLITGGWLAYSEIAKLF